MTFPRHLVSGPRGCRALLPPFPRCSLCAFRLSRVRPCSRRKFAAAVGAAELLLSRRVLKRPCYLLSPTFDYWALAADDVG